MTRFDEIIKVLKTPITKRGKRPSLMDYPSGLRGFPNNKYRGHRAQRLRGFKGNTYGPASPGRQFTPQERQEYERSSTKAGKKRC
jgi:hypothetical protein